MTTKPTPFPFADFVRARDRLFEAVKTQRDPYLLLTGETGVGKTALLDELHVRLDRCRHRVLYFSNPRRLGPAGLIRILARRLRLPIRGSHSETAQAITRHLQEDPPRLCLWFDDGHDLPDDTFSEIQCLAESALGGPFLLQAVLSGQPPLRERLQDLPAFWRRIAVREEMTGLVQEELPDFLSHHFGPLAQALCLDGRTILFEHARGLPGYLLPMARTVLAQANGKEQIDPLRVEDWLGRWDLP